MDNLLKIIIEELDKVKPSTEYLLTQEKFCETETAFVQTLDNAQRKKYFKLETESNNLASMGRTEALENLYNYLTTCRT